MSTLIFSGLVPLLFILFYISPHPISAAWSPIIKLEKHADELSQPVGLVDPKDGTYRLFVVERGGTISIINRTSGNKFSKVFLDVSDRLGPCRGYCTERGLLGLAFHPNYADNGYFYINYTQEDSRGDVSTIVSRFSVFGWNRNRANPNSEQIILTFSQPYSNHNAGDIHFGPDGYLYITSGDGGSGGDPQNFGQQLNTMLGKILRIDVDGGFPYAIPPDNPFVDDMDALDEIWAYGLRNPWRVSFDKETGDFFIADVGQNMYEEVNFQPASSSGGENYGWRLMEGKHCYNPSSSCNNGNLTMPILEYPHLENACSVTGGFRYRGNAIPRLQGKYLYADYCNGYIWAATQGMNGGWWKQRLTKSGFFVSSFGEDVNGELYVVNIVGEVYKVVNPCRNTPQFTLNQSWQTCKWLTKTAARRNKFCSRWIVKKNCKEACGLC